MGRYSSHLLAVLLATADVPNLAWARPIVSSSLWGREVINISREDEEKEEGSNSTPGVAAITGAAIGAGLVFFAFCFIVFWVYKRKTTPKKKTEDAERGDIREGQQRREQRRREQQRKVSPREPRREPRRENPKEPQPVHGAQERSASESTASSASRSDAGVVTQERQREQRPSRTNKEKERPGRTQLRELHLLRQQQLDHQQQTQKAQYTSRQNSPHRFAAELPAAELPANGGPRRPQMARIRGFEMVLPPLQPPPARSLTHPLPPTPPPNQPLPLVPTHARLAAARKLSNSGLPVLAPPSRPPRPDTPQLPPTRTRRPSGQNLTTTTVTPPRLAPLNTRDIRITRPRAATGPSSGVSPKTLVLPTHQPLAFGQPPPPTTMPHYNSHMPQRQRHQQSQSQSQSQSQYQHHHPRQQQHIQQSHQRDPSQQTLVPSPDSGWSLNTYAGTDEQDNNNNAASTSAAVTQPGHFAVSPESPTGGGRSTVYIAFEDGVSPEQARKTSAWTFDESHWPSPLTATTRHQPQQYQQYQQHQQHQQHQQPPPPSPPPPTTDGWER